ncbi:MAG: cytosine permease [Massilibacteroides sp.]|nr:cytosine permease [Massilibacteroides sp.]
MKQSSNDFELSAIPYNKQKGFFPMFVIMMGFTFFSASMWAGGTLGAGLTFNQFFIAVMIGNLILGIYTSLLALIAARTRLSIHLLARYFFGNKGSFIPSSILAFTQIGWFGVGVAMFAIPTSIVLVDLPFIQDSWLMNGDLVNIALDNIQIPANLLYTVVVLSGLLMTSSAYWGIKALSAISIIAVPSIAIFGCYASYRALFIDHPDTIGQAVNGFAYFRTQVPSPENALGLGAAITIVIGSFISGGTCTPDFARFSKSSKIAVWTTALAFMIGNSLMFFLGAAGAAVYHQADISTVLKLQNLLLPAIFVLGLNIWTTNDNALYTSGLGLSNITKLPKKYLVIINGLIGTLASIWLYNNFCGWLNFLNTIIPPIGAILITDFFFLKKGKYTNFSQTSFITVNWPAVIGWGTGAFVALLGNGKIPTLNGGFLSKGLPAINAMVVTIIIYVALSKLLANRKRSSISKTNT